ncbi:malonyl-CoA decarboxylase domain-containing protein [Pelagibacterium lacus]|uniref:Decarboxylase n=1 Tax=Pelagibacterium lacus TaxID=2282655 RepID=A0A369W837_9HYPH|nr:malonyl-CoA decarboxylase family protein [Pelagibacterium lacus]RDE08221.1 decarboxylase [Pelagibacterium lacus]
MPKSSFLSEILSTLFKRRDTDHPPLSEASLKDISLALLSAHGEISGMQLSRNFFAHYEKADADQRLGFFNFLADELDIDNEVLQMACADYASQNDTRSLKAVLEAAEPPRQELLRRLNQAPGATANLVRMRTHLLALQRDHANLGKADLDFVHLFKSWFNRGFVVLRHIDWEAPASILAKIIEYEAVHAIDDWDDLRRRLEPRDRRCFAFFHPSIPNEPLIFVEVALATGVPGSVQALLADTREPIDTKAADTAVFYSISNCQAGLKGISFGNSLIKQVVEELRFELPHLKRFVTLSPMPGLVDWLREAAQSGNKKAAGVLEQHQPPTGQPADDLRELAAAYLLSVRRSDGMPRDPVARFHLGNGGMVFNVNASADTSPNGLRQSCGAMANYLYDLDSIEEHHERYVGNCEVVATAEVQQLAKAAQGSPDGGPEDQYWTSKFMAIR